MARFPRPRQGSSWDSHFTLFYEQPLGLQHDRGAMSPGVLLAKPCMIIGQVFFFIGWCRWSSDYMTGDPAKPRPKAS